MLSYCVNLKAIRYESTSLNRIVANKSHRVIVAEASGVTLTAYLAHPFVNTWFNSVYVLSAIKPKQSLNKSL